MLIGIVAAWVPIFYGTMRVANKRWMPTPAKTRGVDITLGMVCIVLGAAALIAVG